MVIDVNGLSVEIHDNDTVISKRLQRGGYEERCTGLMESWLRPGDTVIDAGAHVGHYSLLAARAMGHYGTVFAFEPCKANYELLRRNVKANGFQGNVYMHNRALSDQCGEMDLSIAVGNSGAHSLTGKGRVTERCSLLTYDGFLGMVPDFVKVDVEGWEVKALRGMSKSIRNAERCAVVVEFFPSLLSRAGHHPAELLDLLRDLGFSLHYTKRQEFMHEVVDGDILAQYPVGSKRHTNLWCEKGAG